MIRLRDKQCWSLIALMMLFLVSCSKELAECGGPQLDVARLTSLRNSKLGIGGPSAYLVLPNPLDATGNIGVQATSSVLRSFTDVFSLARLPNPKRLENNFLKVRLNTQNDKPEILAMPNSKGQYQFAVSDPHYSEVLAYHSITSYMEYVSALGFSFNKARPLYVMVRAKEEGIDAKAVNAIYEHNTLYLSKPRTMKLYGETAYSPGQDQDMYAHEMGHAMIEGVTREVGIDLAGEAGAMFTHGASLHECIADYVAESMLGRPYIGRWIARNFQGLGIGAPLRRADDSKNKLDYTEVSLVKAGVVPDRYAVAEWCTRVLWDIRSQFESEDAEGGAFFADRMILSGLSLLNRDTNLSQFKESLVQADKRLHCGIHQTSIEKAFESRGFKEFEKLTSPLTISARPVVITEIGKTLTSTAQASKEIGFYIVISNPNSEVARNVRVILESRSAGFQPSIYQQGLGDLAPGERVELGKGPLEYYTPVGVFKGDGGGRFKLRLTADNGSESDVEGSLP